MLCFVEDCYFQVIFPSSAKFQRNLEQGYVRKVKKLLCPYHQECKTGLEEIGSKSHLKLIHKEMNPTILGLNTAKMIRATRQPASFLRFPLIINVAPGTVVIPPPCLSRLLPRWSSPFTSLDPSSLPMELTRTTLST